MAMFFEHCDDPEFSRKMLALFKLVGTPNFPEVAPSWLAQLGDGWQAYWRMLNLYHSSTESGT